MDENLKKELRGMLVKFMEASLKHSKINVPQPLPLLEKKAEDRLSTDDLITWKQIMKEWSKVSAKGKKEISKLLLLNAYDVIECLSISKEITEDIKDTPDFIKDHPEYGKPDEEIQSESVIDEFENLFGL